MDPLLLSDSGLLTLLINPTRILSTTLLTYLAVLLAGAAASLAALRHRHRRSLLPPTPVSYYSFADDDDLDFSSDSDDDEVSEVASDDSEGYDDDDEIRGEDDGDRTTEGNFGGFFGGDVVRSWEGLGFEDRSRSISTIDLSRWAVVGPEGIGGLGVGPVVRTWQPEFVGVGGGFGFGFGFGRNGVVGGGGCGSVVATWCRDAVSRLPILVAPARRKDD